MRAGRTSISPKPEGQHDRRRLRGLQKELRAGIEALQQTRLPRRLRRKALQEVVHSLFSIIDADGSGSIDASEHQRYAGMLGAPLDESMLERLDAGHRISRPDFCGFVEACAETVGMSEFLTQLLLLEKALLSSKESFAVEPLYSDLHTARGCAIGRTEHRGITLKQLGLLRAHVERRCGAEGWTDRNERSPAHGEPLVPSAINLYQVCDWVVRPATEKRQCSYVELVAGHPQTPRWFVSHWWGEAVFEFIACLEQHAKDRELRAEAPYWVCAYANNQWKLGEELVEDLEQTSFRKAMNLAEGTVSVLDRDAVCYSRVWCCYEVHTSIVTLKRSDGSAPYRYDMYTALKSSAVGITDGFAKVDLKSRLPCDSKYEREQSFPSHLMERALHIELQQASATAEDDKRRILNCIVGAKDPSSEPPAEHPLYNDLNGTLRGRFAAAGLRSALESSELGQDYLAALAKSKLQKLTLSFYNSEVLTDDSVMALASSLPPGLQDLDLDFSFCTELTDTGVATLTEFLSPHLHRLALSFCGCHGITDTGVKLLAQAIGSRPLKDLSLSFYGNKAVSDDGVQDVIAAFPSSLRMLHFDLSFCWNLSDVSVVALAAALAAGLHGTLRELEVNLRTLVITGDAVQKLAKALPPKLEHLVLDLRFCESLGDASAEAIAAGLPKGLRYLLLHCWSWPALTDRGVKALAAALPESLESLQLFLGCNPKLSDESARALAAALGPALQDLLIKFTDCVLLTSEGAWLPLARALPRGLQHFELWIDGCTDVSKAKEVIHKALDSHLACCVIQP